MMLIVSNGCRTLLQHFTVLMIMIVSKGCNTYELAVTVYYTYDADFKQRLSHM